MMTARIASGPTAFEHAVRMKLMDVCLARVVFRFESVSAILGFKTRARRVRIEHTVASGSSPVKRMSPLFAASRATDATAAASAVEGALRD